MTGATDRQVIDAGNAIDETQKRTSFRYWGEYGNRDNYAPFSGDDIVQLVAPHLVPPGKVIADVSDVLTAEQKAAALTAAKEIRRLYNEHGGGDVVSYEAWKASWLLAKMGGEDW